MTFTLVPSAYAAASTWTGDCVKDGVATIQGINCLVENILNPLPALIGLAAVGMFIMAGVKLMNAGADPKALSSAWSTFTYAAIGIILLAVIWFALVIIENFTGAKVTQFGI